MEKGLEALCIVNVGGRPRKESIAAPRVTTSPEAGGTSNQIVLYCNHDLAEAKLESLLLRPLTKHPAAALTRVLLRGARGVGKTTLAKKLMAGTAYFDCEDLSVQQELKAPHGVFRNITAPVVILDEIAALPNAAAVLRASADFLPGKSVLQISSASRRPIPEGRQDSPQLASQVIHLSPLLWDERVRMSAQLSFEALEEPLSSSGLPAIFLKQDSDIADHRKWARLAYERDLAHEKFRSFPKFLKLLESLMARSGSILDLNDLRADCELEDDPSSLIGELCEAGLFSTVRTISGRQERLKIFAFDPGYVHRVRFPKVEGCEQLQAHAELLWKHLILTELRCSIKNHDSIISWHSVDGRILDFAVEFQPGEWAAIQCKWAKTADLQAVKAFRQFYPKGKNFLVQHRFAPQTITASGMHFVLCTPIHIGPLLLS
jgi:predicted AAA+ superfamily ATPase